MNAEAIVGLCTQEEAAELLQASWDSLTEERKLAWCSLHRAELAELLDNLAPLVEV